VKVLISGALVTELIHAKKSAGSYSVKWNGKTALGVQATSGVYIYSMRCNGKIKSGKMILMK
jgi:flagellar hook assembly protein FlgD